MTDIAPVKTGESHLRVSEIEQRLDLLKYTVDGWVAWPLVRFEAAWNLMSTISHPQFEAVGRRERILSALADLPGLFPIKTARHLVKTYNSGLIDRDGDRYVDIWFDDIILTAGSTFKVEMANSPSFRDRSVKAFVRKDISSSLLEMVSGVLSRRRPTAEMVSVATVFGQVLRDELDLAGVSDDWVLTRLRHFVSLKQVYGALLRRVKPRYVLVADANEYALVAAAKEQGIRVFELQHGIADRTHAAYSWTAYATPFRPTMPLPDRHLLFGEHWKQELAGGGFWGDALRVVGSPRIDRYRAMPASLPDDACAILFTTQGLDVAGVTAFLAEFLARATPRVPVRLTIKLHPLYDTDPAVYRNALSAFHDTVDVVAGNEGHSTFQLLRRSHLHLSISSACHYDAVGLGVPTVILPFQSHEIALPLQVAGHAHAVRTPQDLADLVAARTTLAVPAEVSEYYFKAGALTNILNELGVPA